MKELNQISKKFTQVANRLLQTKYEGYHRENQGMDNLNEFIKFIENQPIIDDFLKKSLPNKKIDFSQRDLQKLSNTHLIKLPEESEEDKINFIYQFLKTGLEKHHNKPSTNNYIHLASHISSGILPKRIDNLHENVIKQFIDYINNHLENLKAK